MSRKKAKKIEKKVGYKRKRAMEEALVKGEVEMKDVGKGKRKDGGGDGGKGEGMDVDVVE